MKMTLGQRLLKAFGYDAVSSVPRRKAPRTTSYDEDTTLDASNRKKLTATTRDIQRNFAVTGWAIRKHLDYVSTFTFQSRTPDAAFNDRLESLMTWWSDPQNCDIRRKHSLRRFIRIAEECRTIDGDVFVSMLQSGQMQAIESDRIAAPTIGAESGSVPKSTQGVILDASGAAVGYVVNKRGDYAGQMQYEATLPADAVYHLGYFDRFDQVRGISRLAAAINTYQDLYEGLTYALAKMKVGQLFGLVTFRDSDAPLADDVDEEDDAEGNSRYKIDFGVGPFHLDLDEGDKADILESKTPSVETQQFANVMIALALKSLDIPYSFYAEDFTNYSGARQALLQYEQSASAKRDEVRGLLNWITRRKVAQWIGAGLLKMPAGMTAIGQIQWEWIPTGLPWIDPLKEVSANAAAIEAGIMSRQMIARANGNDWFDIADQLAAEAAYMQQKKGTADAVSE